MFFKIISPPFSCFSKCTIYQLLNSSKSPNKKSLRNVTHNLGNFSGSYYNLIFTSTHLMNSRYSLKMTSMKSLVCQSKVKRSEFSGEGHGLVEGHENTYIHLHLSF